MCFCPPLNPILLYYILFFHFSIIFLLLFSFLCIRCFYFVSPTVSVILLMFVHQLIFLCIIFLMANVIFRIFYFPVVYHYHFNMEYLVYLLVVSFSPRHIYMMF